MKLFSKSPSSEGPKPLRAWRMFAAITATWLTVASGGIALAQTPPVTSDQTITVESGVSVTVPANVSDATTIRIAGSPNHGTASVSGMSLTYKSTAGYSGPDTFMYSARNRGNGEFDVFQSVTVEVTPPRPTLPTNIKITVPYEGSATYTFNPVNGGVMSVALQPPHGTVTFSGNTATFQAKAGKAGTNFFHVVATNAAGPSTTTPVMAVVETPAAPTLTGGSMSVAFNSASVHDFAPTPGGTLALASAPSHGSVTFDGSRATYLPDTDYVGPDSFGVTGSNPGGTSAVMNIDVTVAPPPIPTLTGGSVSLAFNETGSHDFAPTYGGILAIVDAPEHGVATINGGRVQYVPTADYIGADSVSVTATNPGGTSAPVTLNVTVASPAAPAAAAASLATPFETSGSVDLPVTGQFTSISITADPQHGEVSIAGKSATYKPDPGYFGTDQFTYQAVGLGGSSGPATVSIDVARPGVPTITASASAKTGVGQTVTIPFTTSGSVTSTRIDPSPTNGTATLAVGEVVYQPASGFSGTDTVTVVASGPGGDAAATIEITVAADPVAEPEKPTAPPVERPGMISQEGQAGSPMRFRVAEGRAGIQAVEIVSQPARGVAHVEDLDVMYAPPADFVGQVAFDYRLVTDDGASEPATLTARVHAPAQEAPVKEAAATADMPATVELTEGVLDGPFSDAMIVSMSPSQAGTVELVRSAQTSSAPKAAMSPASAKAGAARAPAEDGGASFIMKFTPAEGFFGEVIVRYSLVNRFAAPSSGLVRIAVDNRPDPSRDPKIAALVSATAQAANNFGSTQIANVSRHLESVRAGSGQGGVSLASARPVLAEEPFVDRAKAAMLADLRAAVAPAAAEDGPIVGTRLTSPLAVWTGGVIELGERRQRDGNSGFDFATSGASVGADLRFSDALIAGAGVGYGRTISDLGDGAKLTAKSYSGFLYASYQPASIWFVDGVLGASRMEFDTQRLTASEARLQGERNGQQWFASITSGLDLQFDRWSITPYGRFEALSADLKEYSETGDLSAALRFAEQTIEQQTGALGLRGSYLIKSSLGVFEPTFRGEYHWSLKASEAARIGYANGQEGERYSLPLTSYGDSRGLIGLGLRWQTMGSWNFAIEAEANHANGGASSSLRISGAGTF